MAFIWRSPLARPVRRGQSALASLLAVRSLRREPTSIRYAHRKYDHWVGGSGWWRHNVARNCRALWRRGLAARLRVAQSVGGRAVTERRVRRGLVACAAVAGLIATAAVPANASTSVFHARFNGLQATAGFSSVSGCIETDALVVAEHGSFRVGNGNPTQATDVEMSLFKGNFCTSTLLSEAFGGAVIPDSAFSVDKRLSGARLSTSVRVTDLVTSENYNIGLNIAWAATDPAITSKTHIQQKSGGFTFTENFHGTSRDARATGALTRGTTTLISGTAKFGTIANVIDGSLMISRQ
jgi:hypothetical protein